MAYPGKQAKKLTKQRGRLLVLVSLTAISAVGLLLWGVGRRSTQPDIGEVGEARKQGSGISQMGRLTVEPEPTRSDAVAGFDSERLWGSYDDWESSVAADPASSYVYQLTTRYDGPAACSTCSSPYIIFRRSADGGTTWQSDRFLAVTRRSQNDPQIKVASDGTIYAAILNSYKPGVLFLKSSNRGDTWSSPLAISAPSWSDKPILAISSDARDVYLAFNARASYVASSHDYGQSFAPPVKTSNDTRYWFHSGGAVRSDGAVYFAATDYSQDYTGSVNISAIRSTNGGQSWMTTQVDTSSEPPGCAWAEGCYLGFFGPTAGLTIDRAGKIMVAYNAGSSAGQPQKLYVRTSSDGVTWSARKEVSNGSTTVNNAFPALAAGPVAGDFRLLWQDDRNGSTTAWNSWYRRTTDGGTTWASVLRLSDLGTGAPYKSTAGYRFPYGDYLDLSVDSGGTNHLIWGEGSSYTGPGGTWYSRGG